MRYDNETKPLPDIMAQENSKAAILAFERDMFKMKSMNQDAKIDDQAKEITRLNAKTAELRAVLAQVVALVNSRKQLPANQQYLSGMDLLDLDSMLADIPAPLIVVKEKCTDHGEDGYGTPFTSYDMPVQVTNVTVVVLDSTQKGEGK